MTCPIQMLQHRVRGLCVRIVVRRVSIRRRLPNLWCARDEHSTRSCVTTKSCFTCGTKGHIVMLYNCPNGRSGCAMMSSQDQECFSSFDKTNIPSTRPLLARQRKSRFFTQECSTFEAQQHATLERRLKKKGLLLGKGGEAYFADDEW
ncbi:hypothetical protein BJ165DRAFT_1509040 [Panaeolus papilionaceus]|nr:hypothetical protein BJ165DRAFT_1509040 [Panaeolus papilionaceus]